jgi:hypothetical protein
MYRPLYSRTIAAFAGGITLLTGPARHERFEAAELRSLEPFQVQKCE